MLGSKYLIIFFIFLLSNCASFIRESPKDGSDSIIIGLSAYVSGRSMTELYFIELEAGDSYLSNHYVIKSNFNMKEQFYLLNAEPGRYIIVAGFNKDEKTNSKGKVTSRKYTTYYFPMNFIKLTDITVERGNIYYLGDFSFWYKPSLKWGINKTDEAQTFYCNRFQPDQLKPSVTSVALEVLGGLLSDETEHALAVNLYEDKKEQQTELQFWKNTIKGLEGNFLEKKLNKDSVAINEEWKKIINKRIQTLQVNRVNK